MRDYKTNNYRNETGYKSAPADEIVLIAIVFVYMVAELSWEQVARYFGF